jgi:prolactin regulatory element-binding protein
VNTVPPPTRNRKANPPKAYLCKWETETWSVQKVRKVGDRALTCFDIRHVDCRRQRSCLLMVHSLPAPMVIFLRTDCRITRLRCWTAPHLQCVCFILDHVDAQHRVQPLVSILKAHDFPPTTIRFNPSGTLLISASADNTLRTVVVPSRTAGHCKRFLPISRTTTNSLPTQPRESSRQFLSS